MQNFHENNKKSTVTKLTPFEAVKAFHHKYGQGVGVPMDVGTLNFRGLLIAEEVEELAEELDAFEIDKVNTTKELADILYVTIGFAVQFGLPLEEVFYRTHESNMTKTGDKRGDGKVLKGEDYVAPYLEDLFV